MTFAVGSVADLWPGDIGFTSISGITGAGVLAGQTGIDFAALLRGRPGATAGWITHAFIVTEVAGGRTTVVEAMPSGAREVTLTGTDRIGPGFAYVRLRYQAQPGVLAVPPYKAAAQNLEAAFKARDMIGIPYGFAQYAAIAGLTLLGGDTANPKGMLARYVKRSPAMICSQLVDEAYRRAGVQLFDDGRPPAYVTPGALFWRAAQLGDVCVF